MLPALVQTWKQQLEVRLEDQPNRLELQQQYKDQNEHTSREYWWTEYREDCEALCDLLLIVKVQNQNPDCLTHFSKT